MSDNPVAAAFANLTSALQQHALANPLDWKRAGGFIEASATLQNHWNAGHSATGKEQAGPGKRRGRKPKSEVVAADAATEGGVAVEGDEAPVMDAATAEEMANARPRSSGRPRTNA